METNKGRAASFVCSVRYGTDLVSEGCDPQCPSWKHSGRGLLGHVAQLVIKDEEGERTLDVTVPSGTRVGRKLCLRGDGLTDGRGGRGDCFATVHIDVPGSLSERERELFQSLSEVSDFNPRNPLKKENKNEA